MFRGITKLVFVAAVGASFLAMQGCKQKSSKKSSPTPVDTLQQQQDLLRGSKSITLNGQSNGSTITLSGNDVNLPILATGALNANYVVTLVSGQGLRIQGTGSSSRLVGQMPYGTTQLPVSLSMTDGVDTINSSFTLSNGTNTNYNYNNNNGGSGGLFDWINGGNNNGTGTNTGTGNFFTNAWSNFKNGATYNWFRNLFGNNNP